MKIKKLIKRLRPTPLDKMSARQLKRIIDTEKGERQAQAKAELDKRKRGYSFK